MLINGKSDSYWLLLFLHQQHSVLFLTYFSHFFSPHYLLFLASFSPLLIPIFFFPLHITILTSSSSLSVPSSCPYSSALTSFLFLSYSHSLSSYPSSLAFLSGFSSLLILFLSFSYPHSLFFLPSVLLIPFPDSLHISPFFYSLLIMIISSYYSFTPFLIAILSSAFTLFLPSLPIPFSHP